MENLLDVQESILLSFQNCENEAGQNSWSLYCICKVLNGGANANANATPLFFPFWIIQHLFPFIFQFCNALHWSNTITKYINITVALCQNERFRCINAFLRLCMTKILLKPDALSRKTPQNHKNMKSISTLLWIYRFMSFLTDYFSTEVIWNLWEAVIDL